MTIMPKKFLPYLAIAIFPVLFVLFMIILMLKFGSESNTILARQLKTDSGLTYGYEALLDDGSVICADFLSEQGAQYFRYHLDSDTLEEVGAIENFALNISGMVQVDDGLYFFANVEENGSDTNTLFRIDIENNTLESYSHHDGSVAMIPVFLYGDHVATMKNVVDGDRIYTFVEWYDPEEDTWHQEHLHCYNSDTRTGSAIVLMYSDDHSLYLLLDRYTAPGVYDTWLVQYDFAGKELQSLILPSEIRELFQQGRLFKMVIRNEFIYITDVSGYGYVGKIEAGTISPIHAEDAMVLSATITPSERKMVFFVRWTQSGYVLDTETGEFSPFTLDLPDQQSICNLLVHGDRIVINCYEGYENTVLYETNLDLVLSGAFSAPER